MSFPYAIVDSNTNVIMGLCRIPELVMPGGTLVELETPIDPEHDNLQEYIYKNGQVYHDPIAAKIFHEELIAAMAEASVTDAAVEPLADASVVADVTASDVVIETTETTPA